MLQSVIVHMHTFAAGCTSGGSFFAIPPWYQYLTCTTPGSVDLPDPAAVFNAIPLIALALLDIGLRLAGMVAIFFVVYGGVSYVVSQGESDKVAQAKGTIINALVGMLIATFAVAIVRFIGLKVS